MAEAQHIDAFIDLVSPYSYFATTYLLSLRPILSSHSVTLTFHPVYLGAIQVTTGNVPPFRIPAKAAYGVYDTPRAAAHFGVPFKGAPKWFPMASMQVMRVLTVLKEEMEEEKFESTLIRLFQCVWGEERNLGDMDVLKETLGGVLGEGEAERVIGRIKEGEVKGKLIEVTKWAMDLGAFGMPFFSVRNKQGEREPFFGSDRFEYMFDYLGLPLQRLRILEKGEVGGAKL